MKTLIVFASTHGCTEKVSNELKQHFEGEVKVVNLKKEPRPELKNINRVIIGGSIHAGQIQKSVKEFCSENLETLSDKELGLFICCMEQGKTAQKQLLESYPEELLQKAKATSVLGGEFDFEKMNFIQKMIIRKVAHIKNSVSRLDYEAIRLFSKRMDKIFNPFLFLA